jgi:hypothetical protein
MYSIKEESTLEVFHECLKLGEAHYNEVEGKAPRIPYNVDYELAKTLIELGLVVIVTARSGGQLVGYFVNLISKDFFTSRKEAKELGIYVKPEFRGSSVFYRMTKATEKIIADKGVVSMYIMFKEGHDKGLAQKLGYEKTETVYQKFLEI